METFFKASPSRVMFTAGCLFSTLFLGTGGSMLYGGIMTWSTKHGFSILLMGVGLFLILLIPLLFLWVPRDYRVTPTAVIVWRWGPKVFIPLIDIRELRRVKIPFYVKTNGTNGFFGDWGQFTIYNNSLGFHDFTAYITRNDTEIAIFRKKGEPIVLSPDCPESFIAAVMERIGAKD